MKKFIMNIINKIKNFNYKDYFKNNILFLTFVLSTLINGCLLRFLTVKNYFAIRPILGDLALIIILGSFNYLFKPKNRFKYLLTLSIVFVAICVINSMYYTNYLSFGSFSLLATSLQIVDVGDAVVENIMELKDFSYIWQLFALIFIYVTTDLKKTSASKGKGNKKLFKNTLISGISFFVIFLFTLTPTDIGRFLKQWNREYIVMRYGIYTYQINDLVIKDAAIRNMGVDEIKDYVATFADPSLFKLELKLSDINNPKQYDNYYEIAGDLYCRDYSGKGWLSYYTGNYNVEILSNINNKIEANISYEYLNEDTKCDLKELSKCSNSNFNYEIGKVTIQNDKIIKMDFHK